GRGSVLRNGVLVLEDGTIYPGYLFGYLGDQQKNLKKFWLGWGELVFNTAMTGYEEILTDPSYMGQMVVMTTPHVGTYGITLKDQESSKAHLSGFVIRELTEEPSNWRSRLSLNEYLRRQKISGIAGIDTRALTLRLRDKGALRAAIIEKSEVQIPPRAATRGPKSEAGKIVEELKKQPLMEGRGLAGRVSVSEPSVWTQKRLMPRFTIPGARPLVAVWDFGAKWNILRELENGGARTVVYPWNATVKDLLTHEPRGIILSNGPGDPSALHSVIDEIRRLLDVPKRPPILGICLGHQLLALACGARTYKMKFGHHGVNHPVKELSSGRTLISSHNHGFAVEPNTIPTDAQVTYISLNDQTIEGFESVSRGLAAAQFHPESSPGPWEAKGLFSHFQQLMKTYAGHGN
ncbi:MAG: glutamine-hydrolyzing carbamoyl-phosphate synthase small subunit, partial [Elusimicrobia bacterium]|nr:glutamine-hydrolyzing carbamoyl-phosphate synthase small subunit [Elusimicrobiota bacterium]